MGKEDQKNKSLKKPYRIAIIFAIVLVLFIAFSGVWYQSGWSSMRDFTQRVYSTTDDGRIVNAQYGYMLDKFTDGDASYTYNLEYVPVTVTKSQVSGMNQTTCISLVLDEYTRILINDDNLTGMKGKIHFVSGSEAHSFYLIAMIITGLLVLLISGYLLTKLAIVDFCKLVGPTVIITGVILMALLYIVYAFYVNGWIFSNEVVFNGGLPIIASMIKEVFTYYIIGVIIVGIILTLPAIPGFLSRGKTSGDKPTK